MRRVVGKAERNILRLLAEKGGSYPSIIALIKDYIARFGYGFYTRRWIKVFTLRLYKMEEKGLIKIVSEPGSIRKAIILQPVGWAYVVKNLGGELVEAKAHG